MSGTSDSGGVDFHEKLPNEGNFLVLSSSVSGADKAVCHSLLALDQPTILNILKVSYRKAAARWLQEYADSAEELPNQLVVIGSGDFTRSTGTASSPESQLAMTNEDIHVEALDSPGDLTGLGILISEYLNDFATQKWDSGATEMAVCFDSLTYLLQYVDVERAFRFLHVITS